METKNEYRKCKIKSRTKYQNLKHGKLKSKLGNKKLNNTSDLPTVVFRSGVFWA